MSEPDFRSDRSESAEGKGIAKRARDAYERSARRALRPVLEPVVEPGARAAGRAVVEDLVGFWVLWHLYGGFEGLERYGFHRATIFRKVKRFRQLFGAHPDEYSFPGITLDPKAYWESASMKVGPRPKR